MADSRREAVDPLKTLRGLLDRGERRVNEILSEFSARDDVNTLRSRLSEAALDAQKRSWDVWARYFQSINLPTRTDIIQLGKRLSELEEGIVRIESQLQRLNRRVASSGENPAADAPTQARPRGPRRTRRPPSEATKATEERQ